MSFFSGVYLQSICYEFFQMGIGPGKYEGNSDQLQCDEFRIFVRTILCEHRFSTGAR